MHKQQQQIYRSPITEEYLVCVLMTNIYNCLYGGQVLKHFRCALPTMEEYLAVCLCSAMKNADTKIKV